MCAHHDTYFESVLPAVGCCSGVHVPMWSIMPQHVQQLAAILQLSHLQQQFSCASCDNEQHCLAASSC